MICAAIRRGRRIFGLIHLYSTDAARVPDPDELEFTLAVADTVAVALENLKHRQELAENLTQVRTENVQLRERLGVQSHMVGNSQAIKRVADEIGRAAASNATCSFAAKAGWARNWSPGPSTTPARATGVRVPQLRRPSAELLASELFGHERARSPGPRNERSASSRRPTAAPHARRNRRDEPGHSGQVPPRAGRTCLRARWRQQADHRRRARDRRDKPRSGEGRGRGTFPPRPLFRLRVLEIIVPALRKRPEDIPLLADYFLAKYNAETGRKIHGFTPLAKEHLLSYLWPGNIRELKNVIERAVVLCRGQEIEQDDLLLTKLATAGDTNETEIAPDEFLPASLADIERRYILATLNHTGWNKSRTSNILGIERSTLDRKIRRYSLDQEAGREFRAKEPYVE